MKTKIITFLVFVLICSSAMAFELNIDNKTLSIHAEQVKLQTILQELVRKTDIEIHMDPDLNPYITADFEAKKLEDGLRIILSSLNYALKWESDFSQGKKIVRLSEIQIFQKGMEEFSVPLQNDAPLDVVRNPQNGILYIKDELLIRLNTGVNPDMLQALIKAFGGELMAENRAMGIYRIKLSAQTDIFELMKQINEKSDVASAEPNYAYPIAVPYRYTANIDLQKNINLNPSVDGVPIAVLDSGLAVDNSLNAHVVASLDALNPDNFISDPLGHGTQMSLVASGIVSPYGAKNSDEAGNPVIAIRTFDKNGYTSGFALMDGVQFALANNARVMSLSWGAETHSGFIQDALDFAASKGMVIVASAGNEPTGKPIYPAAYDSVIGVGALAPDGENWKNTNYGDFVDVYAPGFANMPVGYNADPGIYAGTSISTAYFANRIAGFLARHPDTQPKDILKKVKEAVNKP